MSQLTNLYKEQQNLAREIAVAISEGDSEREDELRAELEELEAIIEDAEEAEVEDHRLTRF